MSGLLHWLLEQQWFCSLVLKMGLTTWRVPYPDSNGDWHEKLGIMEVPSDECWDSLPITECDADARGAET